MIRSIAAVLLLSACAGGGPQADATPIQPTGAVEQYGFVARLGRDTVSVERVTRSVDALISDAVERFPIVRQRHTELELAPDGRVIRMVMTVETPSGTTPDERSRRVLALFTADSVMVSIEQESGTTVRSFSHGGALTVPHASMLYSIIELEIASALQLAATTGQGIGDTLQFRQFYPDRDIGPRFVLHSGRVRPLEDGKIELRHGWLAGAGDVTIDNAGRMLAYSGERSTYKVAVERLSDLPDIEAIGTAFAATEQATGAAALSVRDTASGTIGEVVISVDYGRPLTRGRDLLGNLVPYDRVWRTGANAATQFTTSAPITMSGIEIPAGSYTLWSIARLDGAELILNLQTGQWGTGYNRNRDLARGQFVTEMVNAPMEKFTISIESADSTSGVMVLEWGLFRWTAPIVVN